MKSKILNKHILLSTLVITFVTITIAVMSSSIIGQTQSEQDQLDEIGQEKDWNQIPVADYDSAEDKNPEKEKKRKDKSKRYDKNKFVSKKPFENTAVGRFDESPALPAIPASESDLIIIGQVLDASAYMSSDKGTVYSEFTILVNEVLKNQASDNIAQGSVVSTDREGGFVRYPKGEKVLYEIIGKNLPVVGKQYILFLANPESSPNYNILTGYEIKGSKIYPLDWGSYFEKLKETDKTDFINSIRKTL